MTAVLCENVKEHIYIQNEMLKAGRLSHLYFVVLVSTLCQEVWQTSCQHFCSVFFHKNTQSCLHLRRFITKLDEH